MVGKPWTYKGKNHLFQCLEVEGEQVKLITNHSEITFSNPAMVHFFIEDCKPCENMPTKQEEHPKDQVMAELKGILLENIEKIREDRTYIPQAVAITKQVQTLINLSNLEINVKKMSDL